MSRIERINQLLSELEEAVTTTAIAAYPTPLAVAPPKKKKKYTGWPQTVFTWDKKKDAWDLADDIMWSPWGRQGESKKKKKVKETGNLAFLTRRGRLTGRERAV